MSAEDNREFWRKWLERVPELRTLLRRPAELALREGRAIQRCMTLGSVPQEAAVRRAVEELFGGYRKNSNGRMVVQLRGVMGDRETWLALAEVLNIEPPETGRDEAIKSDLEQTIRRLWLLYPAEGELIEKLRGRNDVKRFVGQHEGGGEELAAIFGGVMWLRGYEGVVTLSELGARCCNDSKALRSGRGRSMLELLLRLELDEEELPGKELMRRCNIIDNPYTTSVVLFAPLVYEGRDGVFYEWPWELWRAGQAVMLSWELVESIKRIELREGCDQVVTSENAAPFHRLVTEGQPALYTEGYPNAAVKRMLQLLGHCGTTALHWGDSDLDGYKIADQVARQLPASLYAGVAELERHRSAMIALGARERMRLKAFYEREKEFRYRSELEYTLAHGWLEQEQLM